MLTVNWYWKGNVKSIIENFIFFFVHFIRLNWASKRVYDNFCINFKPFDLTRCVGFKNEVINTLTGKWLQHQNYNWKIEHWVGKSLVDKINQKEKSARLR